MLIYNIHFVFLYGPAHWAHWANLGFHFLGRVGLALFGPGLAHWKAWVRALVAGNIIGQNPGTDFFGSQLISYSYPSNKCL